MTTSRYAVRLAQPDAAAGPGNGPSGSYLAPHTAEWFRELRLRGEWDRAARAQRHVERAGRVDVCTECGARGAPEYRVVGDRSLPVLGVRLCGRCAMERRAMRGERHVPVMPPASASGR